MSKCPGIEIPWGWVPLLALFVFVLLPPYKAVKDSLDCQKRGFTSPMIRKKTCIFGSVVYYVRQEHFYESTENTKHQAEIVRT